MYGSEKAYNVILSNVRNLVFSLAFRDLFTGIQEKIKTWTPWSSHGVTLRITGFPPLSGNDIEPRNKAE
ncbi:MAG TPA: hypothetical protein LFV92_02775 [Rickettsia endosymbiont of Ceroptres masudai]|nr:hypothetical protein [Rickettsia endosymbiont of Ceroptres masudai]